MKHRVTNKQPNSRMCLVCGMSTPLDRELRVVGRITRDRRRFFEGTGEILPADGSIAVTAEGKYPKQLLASGTGETFKDSEWCVVRSQDDPDAFDII